MSEKFIRILFYIMALVSVVLFLFLLIYVKKIKNEPLAIIEGIYGSVFLDGRRYDGAVILEPNRTYEVIGSATISQFGGKKKIVNLQHFEVKVVWEK